MALGEGLLCRALLEQISQALESSGESFVRQSGYVYQFHLRDCGHQGLFVLDLKHGSGSLRPGHDATADCTFSMLDEDLVAMGKGTLDAFTAMRKGRLEIRGDQLAAHVLSEVMQRVGKRQKAPKSEPVNWEHVRMWRIGAIAGCFVVFVLVIILINPFEVKRSSGGPRELEQVAHFGDGNLHRIGNGVVYKLQAFTGRAFRQLLQTPQAFRVEPSDIFLVGALGSGTTWLSHMLHGLRSGGSMDFQDLQEVVPWYESLGTAGEIKAAKPRLFKSHRTHQVLPSGMRLIVLLRDPFQIMQSQYQLFCNSTWSTLAGMKPAEMHPLLFAPAIFAHVRTNDVWYHFLSWYKCCWTDPQVLWITYEDFVDDPQRQIQKLADFLPEHPGAETIKKVVQQSSRHFMMQHTSKFDYHSLLEKVELFRKEGSPASMPRVLDDTSFEVDPKVKELLDVRWERIVAPATGFATYGEMRRAVAARSAWRAEGVLDLSPHAGVSHSLIASLLLMALLVAFVGLQPRLARSLALRFSIMARARARQIMRHFSDSKTGLRAHCTVSSSRTGTHAKRVKTPSGVNVQT
ncbi:unnamed protein product [Effrenium voratum]|nr:unnamed protein product [Effrenium voratum]